MKLAYADIAGLKLAQANVQNATLALDLYIAQLSMRVGADLNGAQIANDGTVTLAPLNPPERTPLPEGHFDAGPLGVVSDLVKRDSDT